MRRAALGLVALLAVACGRNTGLSHTEAPLVMTPASLDFGPIQEGTTSVLTLHVENAGRASTNLTVGLAAGSSADFTLGDAPVRLNAGAGFDLQVTFTPRGAGLDQGTLELGTGDTTVAPVTVPLQGGPIGPRFAFDPDPLDFRGDGGTTRVVRLQSLGLAGLTITSVQLASSGSPDFSLVPVSVPVLMLPGQSLPVTVDYAASLTTSEGQLEVTTDEPDAGVHHLRLVPDPLPPCAAGATLACYSGAPGTQGKGRCKAGHQACESGTWSPVCTGEVVPAPAEICHNGIDDDCNGQIDEGCPATDACARAPVLTADAYEPNNSQGAAKVASPAAGAGVSTYSYDLTLTPGDEDWFRFEIPKLSGTARARAEVTCLNWGGAGCGTAPKVGIVLLYEDTLQPAKPDAQNDGSAGLAVAESSGPISSFVSQRWYVRVVPTTTVCTGEAINVSVKVTLTNG